MIMNRIIYEQDGIAVIIIPSPNWKGAIEKLAAKDVPVGVDFDIVEEAEIPSDRLFRNAWVHDKVAGRVKTNLPKAKLIAHEKRRAERDELFAPLDVEATIPSKAVAAEAARQVIRDADDVKQVAIDGAVDEAGLRELL